MLPHQKNKVDISSLSEEEQKLFRMYGKLPSKKDMLGPKSKERKYFDSGDYALSKAGKTSEVGSKHPLPENIPHSHNSTGTTTTISGTAAPPSKESLLLHAKSPTGSQEPTEGEEEIATAPDDATAPASPTRVPLRWQGALPDA